MINRIDLTSYFRLLTSDLRQQTSDLLQIKDIELKRSDARDMVYSLKRPLYKN